MLSSGAGKPRKYHKGLTRDGIIFCAIEMLDEEGLDAFSLRRLASRLGINVSSLYEYFPGKNELLGAVFHSINDGIEHDPDDTSGWQKHLRTSMYSYRRLLVSHPYLFLINKYSDVNLAVKHVEMELAPLIRDGFTPEEAGHVFSSARVFAIGSAINQIMSAGRAEARYNSESPEEQARFPHLAQSIKYIRDSYATFEIGLECLLQGLEEKYKPRNTQEHPTP